MPRILKITPFILLLCLSAAQADVLEMKGGKLLNGKYVGGTAETVRFETAEGVQVIGTADVIALTFTASSSTTKPATLSRT